MMLRSMLFAGGLLVGLSTSLAQDAAENPSLAATLGVYVFPAKGQDAAKQSSDEADCYSWARMQTGVDPIELSKQVSESHAAAEQAQQSAQEAGAGSAAGGAAVGAASGALIGGVFGSRYRPFSAARGAVAGAAIGGVASAAHGQREQAAAAQSASQAQAQAQAEAQTAQSQLVNFKKALSACLDGKGYTTEF
jgi:uncharacterized protein YcfJ